MKSIIFSIMVLPLKLIGESVHILEQFTPGKHSTAQAPQAPQVQLLPPKLNTRATRKKIRYGPYVIPGANEKAQGTMLSSKDVNGSLAFTHSIPSVCDNSDCMVLFGDTSLEFPNGSLASISTGVYNHHVLLWDSGRHERPAICPGSTILDTVPKVPAIFIGGAADAATGGLLYTSPDGNFKSGYYIQRDAKQGMSAEIMNYHQTASTVYVVVETEYMPGQPPGYLDVHNVVLSAMPCNKPIMDLPKPQYSTTSEDWIVPSDGYIVNIRGHEHDGGTSIIVHLNGKQICESTAEYGGKDFVSNQTLSDGQKWATISAMSPCRNQYEVKKGDKITATANYDLIKHPLRENNKGMSEGVMGMANLNIAFPVGYVLPE